MNFPFKDSLESQLLISQLLGKEVSNDVMDFSPFQESLENSTSQLFFQLLSPEEKEAMPENLLQVPTSIYHSNTILPSNPESLHNLEIYQPYAKFSILSSNAKTVSPFDLARSFSPLNDTLTKALNTEVTYSFEKGYIKEHSALTSTINFNRIFDEPNPSLKANDEGSALSPITVYSAKPALFDVLSNDTPLNNTLITHVNGTSITEVTEGGSGVAVFAGAVYLISGKLLYIEADTGHLGSVSFSYTISDTTEKTDTANVYIDIPGYFPAIGGQVPDIIGTNDSEVLHASDTGTSIFGNGGDDIISGDQGHDTLFGGSGSDILTGGRNNAGIDKFGFVTTDLGTGIDIITDFQTLEDPNATDLLDLSNLLIGAGYDTLTDDLTDFLHAASDGTHTTVSFNTNGDGIASNYVDMAVLLNVSAGTIRIDTDGGAGVDTETIVIV